MKIGKIFANRGVERNKKPLSNLVYKFEAAKPVDGKPQFIMLWGPEKRYNKGGSLYWHGLVFEEQIKKILSEKQWCKFKQGTRFFIVQRRINKRNIPKK